jgi:hypothetical protein
MTTHNLAENLTSSLPAPVAVAMFHDRVDYAASDAFRPTL